MAENKDDQNEGEAQAPKPKKPMNPKVKLLIIVLVGLLVVVGSIVGTLVMLGVFEGDDSVMEMTDEAQSAESQADGSAAQPAKRPAMYFPIKPAFVVNFPTRGKQRYLQVDITVMTRDPDIFTAMQAHMPLIKNNLVMLLGGQVYEEMQTDEGKELLRQKAMQTLNEIMQQELGKDGVEEVLFTNFVMQ